MAFKTFVAGDVLTAADVNTYLAKQAVIVCTAATRPSSPVEGMVIYQTDNDALLVYTGTLWQELTSVISNVAAGSWTPSATFTDAGPSIVLPAGRWCVEAKGNFDHSTAAVQAYEARLWDSTNSVQLDVAQINTGDVNGRAPWSLFGTSDRTTATTVKIQAVTSVVGGAQLIANMKLWARPVSSIR